MVAILGLLASAAGCGGESGSAGDEGICVGDTRDPKGCKVSWELIHACPQLDTPLEYELAVFPGGCPTEQALRNGETALAVARVSFEPTETFPPLKGLEKKAYGFAFLGRNGGCAVTSFGCTDADLAEILGIKTAVCDWSGPDGTCACTSLLGGGCPIPESCLAGKCSGTQASGG